MARAMILAAGLGTRLRPLTDELPKPLVPLGDRPFLAHVVRRLSEAGFTEIVMNTHHGAENFRNHIKELGGIFHLLHEDQIRGTAGGIAGARAELAPAPVIVWNGDILADPPLDELLRAAAPGGLALLVAPRPLGAGTLGVGNDGQVVRLRGERFGLEVAGGDYVGIAGLGARALAELPDVGCLVADYALPVLRSGGVVRTVLYAGSWSDIGTVAAYHSANLAWLADHGSADGSWVHPDARVGEGIVLTSSVVGSGAYIEGRGEVERAVLWPGARARAPLVDVVVTTLGKVVSR